MRKSIVALVLICCLPFVYGFATVVSGTKQDITVNSSPTGAEVIVDGFVKGVTPLTLNIKRQKDKSIIVRKDGYQDYIITMSHKFNMAFWGNALIGGLIGSSIDSSTGATIEYEPSSFHVTLKPGSMTKSQREDFNKVAEARNFILINYHNLSSDIAEGNGQYLSNLYEAFQSGYHGSSEALDELRDMLTQYESIPEFAEAVVHRFIDS